MSVMEKPSEVEPSVDSTSVWLIYVGSALLALGILMWRVSSTPLAGGGDTDRSGLAFVAVTAGLAGLITAVTGLVGWLRERRLAQQERKLRANL
jgi:hypothetical protein